MGRHPVDNGLAMPVFAAVEEVSWFPGSKKYCNRSGWSGHVRLSVGFAGKLLGDSAGVICQANDCEGHVRGILCQRTDEGSRYRSCSGSGNTGYP